MLVLVVLVLAVLVLVVVLVLAAPSCGSAEHATVSAISTTATRAFRIRAVWQRSRVEHRSGRIPDVMADTLRTTELLSIGQLSARGGIAASALRFYESQGLLKDQRTDSGQRRYLRDTLRRVAFIKAAQEVGLSLEDIRLAFEVLPPDHNATEADWAALAERWQAVLTERLRLLQQLSADRGKCIGCGCLTLADCATQNPADIAYELGHSAQYLLGHTLADAEAAQAKVRAKRSR
ncbi:unannotated protein [freshwater metagenome]|uniref:Unannotated protein n=2 Tax=freshwater metagenome TaxID=449393 RepID=A0A6J6RIB0_9ZZZZ